MDISLLTFALMAAMVVMTPGPTVLLALTNGSRFGVRGAGFGFLGAAVSDAVLIAAASLGLGALLLASALLFNLVKWIGVAYLLWLGWQMATSTGGFRDAGAAMCGRRISPPGHAMATFRKSFLVAVTNPKGYLFFAAFLPQFISLAEPLAAQYLTLGAIFIAIDVAVMLAYAGMGAKAMRVLSGRGALWLDRTCGVFLLALGAALALLRRSDI